MMSVWQWRSGELKLRPAIPMIPYELTQQNRAPSQNPGCHGAYCRRFAEARNRVNADHEKRKYRGHLAPYHGQEKTNR
jgi:hypothetical protein